MSEINGVYVYIDLDDELIDKDTIDKIKGAVYGLNVKKFKRKLLKLKEKDLCSNDVMKILSEFEKEFISKLLARNLTIRQGYKLDDYDLVIATLTINNKYDVLLTLREYNYVCGTTLKEIMRRHPLAIYLYVEPHN